MVVGVFHLTHQIEIAGGSRHDAAIVPAARRRPALPPAGRPSLTASSRSHTSISPRGYDVTGLFQSATALPTLMPCVLTFSAQTLTAIWLCSRASSQRCVSSRLQFSPRERHLLTLAAAPRHRPQRKHDQP